MCCAAVVVVVGATNSGGWFVYVGGWFYTYTNIYVVVIIMTQSKTSERERRRYIREYYAKRCLLNGVCWCISCIVDAELVFRRKYLPSGKKFIPHYYHDTLPMIRIIIIIIFAKSREHLINGNVINMMEIWTMRIENRKFWYFEIQWKIFAIMITQTFENSVWMHERYIYMNMLFHRIYLVCRKELSSLIFINIEILWITRIVVRMSAED